MATRWTSKHTGKKIDDTIDGVCNSNLLDNWYFGNPVNQRGQTEYNTMSYAIDRWRTWSEPTSAWLKVVDGGIKVAYTFFQYFEKAVIDGILGKNVTISILFADGKLFYKTGFVSKSGVSYNAVDVNYGGITHVALGVDTSGTGNTATNYFRVAVPVNGTLSDTILAIKLELGDHQTLAHQDADGNWVLNEIPDYGEQLARCQRYQIPWESYERVRAPMVNASNLDFVIPTPVTMRTKPVINTSVLKICKLDGTEVAGFSFAVKESVDPGFVSVRATKNSHGLTDALLYVSTRSIIDANL